MESLWRKQTKPLVSKPEAVSIQSEENHWDVIVIGAGMAGLLIAWYLKEEGKKVLVLEANEIASGQTERTTAKITSQHGLKYSKLIESVGIRKARLYAQANERAIREYEKLIQEQEISCQFERVPAYLYTKQKEELLKEEAKAASSLGIDAFFTKETELPFAISGAVCFRNQAQFSPLEFVRHICAKLETLEYTKVIAVRGHRVITENMTLTADKIVAATHYPTFNVPGFYFLRQHQEKSYVMALRCEKTLDGMYYGIDENSLSFRSAEGALLLGGGEHRTGKCLCQLPEEEKTNYGYTFLKKAVARYYPELKEIAHWSAQDCMSHDKIPFIGKYSHFRPYWFVATGFKKWGMTSSMVSAMILSDCISERISGFEKTFSPQRLLIRAGMKDFLVDVVESIMGLSKGLFSKKERRCPHIGCRLEWNNEEDRWDCPCHGSGFDKNGELLDNPAQTDIRK